jgi:hypothetical protein
MSIIGALLSLSSVAENSVLNPNSSEYSLINSSDTKDYVFTLLLRFGKMEQSGRARCIALSSIGIFMCEELRQGQAHPKMREAISVLLMSLRVIYADFSRPIFFKQNSIHSAPTKRLSKLQLKICCCWLTTLKVY